MTSAKGKIVLFFLIAVLALGIVAEVLKERIVVEIICPKANSWGLDSTSSSKIPFEKVPYLEDRTFEVEVLKSNNSKSSAYNVEFLPPVTESGGRLTDKSQYHYDVKEWGVEGSWREDAQWAGGYFKGSTSGSVIGWEGASSDLKITFKTGPDMGQVVLRGSSRGDQTVDLYSSEPGEMVLELVGASAKFQGSYSIFNQNIYLPFRGASKPEISFSYRNKIIYKDTPSLSEGSSYSFPVFSKVKLVSEIFLDLFLVLIRAFIFPTLCVFLGFGLMSSLILSVSKLEYVLISFLAGFCVLSELVTSLAYYFPAGHAGLVLMGFGLIFSLIQNFRRDLPSQFLKMPLGMDKSGFYILIIGVFLGVLYTYSRIFIEPGFYLGHSLTDSVDYIAWAEILTNNSYYQSGINPWRLSDLVVLSLGSYFSGVEAVKGYALSAFSLSFVFCFLVFSILRRLNVDEFFSILAAIVGSVLASLFILFEQSYYAQFLTTVLVVAGIFSSLLFLDQLAKREIGFSVLVLNASIYALVLSTYPYICFPPVVLGLVLIYLGLRGDRKYIFTSLSKLVVLSCILVNINFNVILDFGDKTQHLKFLNEIAKTFIFPYYEKIRMLYVLLGLREFSEYLDLDLLPVNELVLVFMMVASLALVCFGFIKLLRDKSVKGAYLFFVICSYLMVSLILFESGQIYSFGKYGLLLGLLLLFPMFVGAFSLSRFWALPVFILCAYFIFNFLTVFQSHQYYSYARNSKVIRKANSHLSVISPLLVEMRDEISDLETEREGEEVYVIGNLSEFSSTDKERVFYNRMFYFFKDWPINTLSPQKLAHYQGFYVGRECKMPEESGIYVIFKGYEKCFELEKVLSSGAQLVLENEYLEVVRL